MTASCIGAAVLVVALAAVVFAAGVAWQRDDDESNAVSDVRAAVEAFTQVVTPDTTAAGGPVFAPSPVWVEYRRYQGTATAESILVNLPVSATGWRVLRLDGAPTVRYEAEGSVEISGGINMNLAGWEVGAVRPTLTVESPPSWPWELVVEVVP